MHGQKGNRKTSSNDSSIEGQEPSEEDEKSCMWERGENKANSQDMEAT